MNPPRQLVVREIQLAHMLGFTDVEPFRRALKSGDVPAPNEYLSGRPVWYLPDLERRYGAGAFDEFGSDEIRIMDRIAEEF
ncbi:MAG: hypothetical protein ACR2RE_12415 [Geminicoccaceae bacterium]